MTIAAGALALAVGGCDSGTSLLLEVTDSNTSARFSNLHVRVYDLHSLIADGNVAPVVLPGAVTVQKLPAQAMPVRVIVEAEGEFPVLTAVQAITRAGQRVIVPIDLSMSLGDRDGDGIPDGVDDCPDTPDPNQKSAHGGPPGDACGGANLPPDFGVGGFGDDMAMGTGGPPPDPGDMSMPQLIKDLATTPTPVDMAGVLFDDEFDTLDTSKWTVNTSAGSGHVSVANGVITLTADKVAGAWAEIVSKDTFPVGTNFFAQVNWAAGQTYEAKEAGFADSRIADVCGAPGGEREAAMLRGQSADLYYETSTGGNAKCMPIEGSMYKAGNRLFEVDRISTGQVDLKDSAGTTISSSAFISAANLPIRFAVYSSSANAPVDSAVVMTVDWVRVVKR